MPKPKPKYRIRTQTQAWEYYLARIRRKILSAHNAVEQVPDTPAFQTVTQALKWGKTHNRRLKRWRGAVLVRPVVDAVSSGEEIEEIS